MGGIFSSLFGWMMGSKVGDFPEEDLGPNADVKNPQTGLTPREVSLVKRSWNIVRPYPKQNGISFFIMLFKTHPVIQSRFKAFVGKDVEELRDSKRLAAHATTVMTALDSYVLNLDDISCLIELLKTTGANHKKRGIQKSDFELLAPVLVQFLKNNLSSIWSDDMENAWNGLMKVVLSIIFIGYDEAE